MGGEAARIGSFEQDGKTLQSCFMGTRVLRGDKIANQSICLSFDPATLSCICCAKEHQIILGTRPVCVCVADQNFAPNLSGGEDCVSVIRLESGSLDELCELVQEIFGENRFPPGSVLCLGSASHLHRVGLTIYTQDWIRTVAIIAKKIEGVQICPLIPILYHCVPGSLATDIVQLATWLSTAYKGTTLGLIESWIKLAQLITTHTVTEASGPVYHSVALPDSLKQTAQLTPHRFLSTSSRRVISEGFDAKAINELLCTLLTNLQRDLGITCNPRGNPVRVSRVGKGLKETVSHVILVGSSNMRRTAEHIKDLGLRVTECPLNGGIPNDNAIEQITTSLQSVASEQGTAVVFDLFGNFVHRFEQADGNMALPIWLGGKPHLLGRVGVCSDKTFKELIIKLLPLFGSHPQIPKVILPPIPRYLGGGCCPESTHAGGVAEPNHAANMVGHTAHLRKILRGELSGSTVPNYWIPDILESLAPSTAEDPAGSAANTFELMSLFSGDNVHLTPLGYARLAVSIVGGAGCAQKKQMESECVVTGVIQNFYWRGFVSQVGSSRPKMSQQYMKMRGGRGRGGPGRGGRGGPGQRHHHQHPYSR